MTAVPNKNVDTSTDSAVMSHQVMAAYPTLIGKFQPSGTAIVNQQLLSSIVQRESQSASHDYANVGSWHSQSDLLEWGTPEVGQLRAWISEALSRMVQATGQLPEVQERNWPPRGNFRVSAWANVARRGHYHRMHNHPGCVWSGVYYVSSPAESSGLEGVLEFYDPRPFTEMLSAPGSPYGQRMLVRPSPGLLVLFPSWLYHFVHPIQSDEPRVSIAFNASWHSL